MQDETPQDIRDLAARLEELGERERLDAENACLRVTMRTGHLISGGAASAADSGVGVSPASASERLRMIWLWLAAPAVAAAAVLVAVFVMSPNAAITSEGTGVEVLAAGIESDIDAWLELDAMWADDSFESTLTALSIDAAGLASESVGTVESLDTYPDLEGDL